MALDDATPDLVDAATCLPVKRETESDAAGDAVAEEDAVDLSDSLLHTIEWDRIVLDEAHKTVVGDLDLTRLKSNMRTMTNCGTPMWCAPEVSGRER